MVAFNSGGAPPRLPRPRPHLRGGAAPPASPIIGYLIRIVILTLYVVGFGFTLSLKLDAKGVEAQLRHPENPKSINIDVLCVCCPKRGQIGPKNTATQIDFFSFSCFFNVVMGVLGGFNYSKMAN